MNKASSEMMGLFVYRCRGVAMILYN